MRLEHKRPVVFRIARASPFSHPFAEPHAIREIRPAPPFVIPIAQLYVTSLQTSRREMTTRRESDDEWFEPCRQAHG